MNGLTITLTPPEGTNPRDAGFVLHKHPDRVFERRYGSQIVRLWFEPDDGSIRVRIQAETERPIKNVEAVLSSTLVAAFPKFLGTAMAGGDSPAAGLPWGIDVDLPVLRCKPLTLRRYLGADWFLYSEPIESVSASYPDLGLHHVALWTRSTIRNALCQLWVAVGAATNRKPAIHRNHLDSVMTRGGDWLAIHPCQDEIIRRVVWTPRSETESKPPRSAPLADTRARFIAGVIREAGARCVLEIGCSTGESAIRVRKALGDHPVENWVGIDPDSRAVRVAKNRETDGLSFIVGNGFAPPEGQWDVIILSEVIEHLYLDEVAGFMDAISRIGAGTVVITVPNREYNTVYNVPDGRFRHGDHKWEPSRAEFSFMASGMTAWGRREIIGIGDEDPKRGHPSLGLVLTDPVETSRSKPPRLYREVCEIERGSHTIPFIPETTPAAGSGNGQPEDVGDALAYYAGRGVETVVVEVKHMGSRVVVLVPAASSTQYPTAWYRSGRRIPPDRFGPNWLVPIVCDLRKWATRIGIDPESDVVVDGELMPWSASAGLLGRDYATMASAARTQIGPDSPDWFATGTADLCEHLRHYLSPRPLRYAPFDIRAISGSNGGGVTNFQRDLVLGNTGGLATLASTLYIRCETQRDGSITRAHKFFDSVTNPLRDLYGIGFLYEGVVVKPMTWNPSGAQGARAVKVRSESYLNVTRGIGYSRESRLMDRRKELAAIKQAQAATQACEAWARGDVEAHRTFLDRGLQNRWSGKRRSRR